MADLSILDNVRLNFSPGSLTLMNVVLAFVMFRVALQIRWEDFKHLFQSPKPMLVGIISQMLILPACTFLLCLCLKPMLSQSVAMGMILVAACPGGNMSNFISTLANGNIPLSVSLSAFSTLTCVFITPLNFALWGGWYSTAAQYDVPIRIDFFEMLQTVVLLLGIPIVLGMLFSKFFPKLTQKLMKPFNIISLIAFAGFVIAALAANFQYFLDYVHLIALIVFLHNAVALGSGYLFGRACGLVGKDVRTITIETGIQNSGLGLILIFNPDLFNGIGGMAFVAAFWGIWHIISGLTVASLWRRHDRIKNA